MDSRKEVLKSIFKKFDVIYIPINDKTSFAKIYDLFVNDKIFEPINGIEYCYLGLFFKIVKEDYVKAKNYYLMAIKHGSIIAMHNLAYLYIKIKDYDNAEHYFFMAIRQNYTNAFNGLAWFYNNIKKDSVNAETYYKIAVSHNNISAMYNLACFYYSRNNFIDAEFYSLLAIKNGNMASINYLIYYYKITNNIIELIKLFIEYHKFIERKIIINYIEKIWKLELDFDQNKCLVKFLLSFEFQMGEIPTTLKIFTNLLKNKMIIIKLHFDYTINGKGFHDAKKDFNNRITC